MHQIAGISFPKNFKKVDYKCEKIKKFIVTFQGELSEFKKKE